MSPKLRLPTAVFCCVLLLLLPSPVDAGLGLSFDLFSVGPFSLGIGIPLRGALPLIGILGIGALVVSFFSGGGSGSYSAHYSGGTAVRHTVTVKPDDHLSGRSLKVRFSMYSWLDDGKITLPGTGYLEIEDDGRMAFRDAGFEGHTYLHFDDSLSVWDQDGEPVLVLKPSWRSDEALLLVEKSERASTVVEILFGEGL